MLVKDSEIKFSYRLIDDFPPLAWVASPVEGTSTYLVTHGRFVEVNQYFFTEGAWAGNFKDGGIHNSASVFGSGAALEKDAAWFVSCTATTDFLYYSVTPSQFSISNSLPLLLAKLQDALVPGCAEYSKINRSILSGIRQYQHDIPTQNGCVKRLMHHNLRRGANGIELIEKPLPPPFSNFHDYRDFLHSQIGMLLKNARDPARQAPLRVYSTQSRGYDSTAVNALAAPFGIDRVYTSPDAKENRAFFMDGVSSSPQDKDDGTPICEHLNLACSTIDRLGFQHELTREHLYWAGLDNNQDFNLHDIHADENAPALVLTGNLGEIWYPSSTVSAVQLSTFTDELIRWDQTGHGLSEVRLNKGTIQAAVPFIGARRRSEILQISDSPEMDPYRLPGNYDRPIPRRIAEESGVPRNLFGQTKLASIVHFPTPNLPQTRELRQQFLAHLRRHRLLGRGRALLLPAIQRLNNWIYWQNPAQKFTNRKTHPFLWHLGYYLARILRREIQIRTLWGRIDSYLYSFCVNLTIDEYGEKLVTGHDSTGKLVEKK